MNTNNQINIMPKTIKLSADELIAQSQRKQETTQRGSKRVFNDGSDEQKAELKDLYDKLHARITTRRIMPMHGGATAIWNSDEQAMEVVCNRKLESHIGYKINDKRFLHFYEAMFLLEMKLIQFKHHSMLMSVEQAYVLLFGENATEKYAEYLVYAFLTRSGFILRKHDKARCDLEDVPQTAKKKPRKVTAVDCAWALLRNSLNNAKIPKRIMKSQHFNKTKQDMEETKSKVIEQKPQLETTENEVCINFKQKFLPICKKGKRKRCASKSLSSSSNESSATEESAEETDCPKLKKLKTALPDMDVIKINPSTEFAEDCRDIKISFDLYVKNEHVPSLCVTVWESVKSMPTHSEIIKSCKTDNCLLPLVVVCVNANRKMSSYLYCVA